MRSVLVFTFVDHEHDQRHVDDDPHGGLEFDTLIQELLAAVKHLRDGKGTDKQSRRCRLEIRLLTQKRKISKQEPVEYG